MREMLPSSMRWRSHVQPTLKQNERWRRFFSAWRRSFWFYAPVGLVALILILSASIGRNLALILNWPGTRIEVPAALHRQPRSSVGEVQKARNSRPEVSDKTSNVARQNSNPAPDQIAIMRRAVVRAFPVDWPPPLPDQSNPSEGRGARSGSDKVRPTPIPFFEVDASCAKYIENYLRRQCVLREQKSFDHLISEWDRTGSAIRANCIARSKLSPTDQYRVLDSCVHVESAKGEVIRRLQDPSPRFDYRGYFSEGAREQLSY
jgi:hypothetical protein